MGLRKLLSSLTKQADETLPALRKTTIPTEVGPEVIGAGTSRAAREATEEIPEAIYKEITPTTGMDDMSFLGRMDPRLAKLIGAGGAAIGGGMLLSGGDEQPPVSAPIPKVQPVAEPEQVLPDNYNELAQQEALDQSIVASPASIKTPSIVPSQLETPTSQGGMDFLKMIQDSQARREEDDAMADLLRASEYISGGVSRTKVDTSSSDLKRERAKERQGDVDKEISAIKQQQAYDNAQKEIQDVEKLRDVNSDISKTAREIATSLGIKISPTTTAKQLQDGGLNLGTLLSTKIAADSRREMAALAKEQKSTKIEKDLSQQQRKFVQGLRKEMTSGVLGKQYATFSTGQRMSSALQKFAENPTGYSDYATLMGGLKVLQGDESVVREAEVRMGMAATSLFDSLQNDLQKLQSGKALQPNQRKAMIDTIQTLTDLSKQQYMHAAAPILEQAEMEGISPNVLLSGSLSGAKEEAKPSESQPLTTGTVTIRRKSDGATKVMSADKASKMDKTKYEIVK